MGLKHRRRDQENVFRARLRCVSGTQGGLWNMVLPPRPSFARSPLRFKYLSTWCRRPRMPVPWPVNFKPRLLHHFWGTDNHLMLIDLRSKPASIGHASVEEALVQAGITINKNISPIRYAIPFCDLRHAYRHAPPSLPGA